jgi:hypothetical protein
MNSFASRTRLRDQRPILRSGHGFPALFVLIISTIAWVLPTLAEDPSRVPAKAQVASAANDHSKRVLDSTATRAPSGSASLAEVDPIARARAAIADCKSQYLKIQDYTCTFFKRERIDGKLYTQHIMNMKARTKPASLYFKFIQPNSGREAIFIHGKNNNKIVAHDVGFGRLVAGTMHLDPNGDMAMEENRHPVTEAGLGSMIDLVKARWDTELHPGESVLRFHPQAAVGDRPCLMIESIHPRKTNEFLFDKVNLYIDRELNLPIRFEAYDWPKADGVAPELVEEYGYSDIKVNVGLDDHDFDVANREYAFGRL